MKKMLNIRLVRLGSATRNTRASFDGDQLEGVMRYKQIG